MRLRVARGDHRLKFGCVFAEVVPECCKCGGLRSVPHLREPPRQARRISKMLFEIVRCPVARPAMGDGSWRPPDLGVSQTTGHIERRKFSDRDRRHGRPDQERREAIGTATGRHERRAAASRPRRPATPDIRRCRPRFGAPSGPSRARLRGCQPRQNASRLRGIAAPTQRRAERISRPLALPGAKPVGGDSDESSRAPEYVETSDARLGEHLEGRFEGRDFVCGEAVCVERASMRRRHPPVAKKLLEHDWQAQTNGPASVSHDQNLPRARQGDR